MAPFSTYHHHTSIPETKVLQGKWRNCCGLLCFFLCRSPSSSPSPTCSPPSLLSSTHPTPKYGAITNSFTKAPELLVTESRVSKCSARWWKHVIWSPEETSGAFQAFMDKKSRLVVCSSAMHLNWIKEAKAFQLKLSRQSNASCHCQSLSLVIPKEQKSA